MWQAAVNGGILTEIGVLSASIFAEKEDV